MIKFLTIVVLIFVAECHCWSQELPIKSTRKISFVTDEGSFMNIDASPDGKNLAFDLLGDIYIVSTAGGTAKQLTKGVALNLRPVWSNNGKKIAYISDVSGTLHLNIMDAEGKYHQVLGRSGRQVSYGLDVKWLPGDNYVSAGDSIYGIGGGKQSQKVANGKLLNFSNDGSLIYYTDTRTLYCDDLIKNIKKSKIFDLGNNDQGMISPDGKYWVYELNTDSASNLIVKDLYTGNEKVLVKGLNKFISYRAAVPTRKFSFSPDSKLVFISYGGKIHRIDITNGANSIIHFTANVNSGLGKVYYKKFEINYKKFDVRYLRNANISPDGKHIVFAALNKLYVKDLPNGIPKVLIPQSVSQYQPVYSPDGKWIAYVSWCDTIGGHLWKVSSSGGNPEQLSNIAGQYQRPAWSPDGKLIAVVMGSPVLGDRDYEGEGKLALVPVNGDSIQFIGKKIPLWNNISFSLDGNSLFYQPWSSPFENSNVPLLVSSDLKGENFRVIAEGPKNIYRQQITISPNGRFIVYSEAEDLYLIPVFPLQVQL
jgi:Tol biopolymer transport system component